MDELTEDQIMMKKIDGKVSLLYDFGYSCKSSRYRTLILAKVSFWHCQEIGHFVGLVLADISLIINGTLELNRNTGRIESIRGQAKTDKDFLAAGE